MNDNVLEQTIKIDTKNCLASQIGNENGINDNELAKLETKAKEIHRKAHKSIASGKIGFCKIPYDNDFLNEIESLCELNKGKWDDVIVFGIGGSALGITMLKNALLTSMNHRSSNNAKNVNVHVMDNIDPDYLIPFFNQLNFDKTLILLITKSGSTVETWGSYYQFISFFDREPNPNQIIAITDPEKGYLREFSSKNNWTSLDIPSDVGGRFSVLTPVGLLPASLMGLNIREILNGARIMAEKCKIADFYKNPAIHLSLISMYLLEKKAKSIFVMMPYSNALLSFADWFRQLWAESLGKRYDIKGNSVFAGQTPVKALGATDQHSQVQLYREGPNDKLINFIEIETFKHQNKIKMITSNSPLFELNGLNIGEVLNMELAGTREALTQNQRPNLTVKIPQINCEIIGQLIYLYELMTYYSGIYLNIDPFDQPGVEAGKIITKRLIHEHYNDTLH